MRLKNLIVFFYAFGIRLPCSGYVSSEVDIRIHLNVTSSVTSNTTIVELRRRKPCLKGGSQLLISDADNARPLTSTMKPKDESKGGVVAVAMVIGSVVVLCGVVLSVVFCNARKKPSHPIDYHLSQTNCSRLTAKDKNGNKSASASCTRSLLSAAGSPAPLPPPAIYVDRPMTGTEVTDASQISLRRVIMEGSVGRLYYGVLLSVIGEFQHSILVKTMKGEVQDVESRMFVSEVNSLRGCNHRNILPVLTCVLKPVNQPLAVYRFYNDCNLKIYLRTCRSSQAVTCLQMLQMVLCICDGLCYLHSRSILHKDVATRNCLVDDCLNVRLTDSALSSDFFPEDYFTGSTGGGGDPVPVRWLPRETLELGAYDANSEVWSFGVSAWEVFTFGQQPYSETESTEIVHQLSRGYRLPSPTCCSEQTYQLLIGCWRSKPQSRPSLTSLFASFERICASQCQFT